MKTLCKFIGIMSIAAAVCLTLSCDGGSGSGGCECGSSSSSSSSSGSGDNGSSSSSGSGGGGGGGDPPTVLHLEGTLYESGYQLNTTVYLRDSAQNQRTTPSNGDGTFVFDEIGLVPPFILWATVTATDSAPISTTRKLYSTCGDGGTVNITSLTDLVMAIALDRGPADYYAAEPYAPAPDTEQVAEAQEPIHYVMSDIYPEIGLGAGFDLMVDDMGDSVTGYRQVLDLAHGYSTDNACAMYLNSSGTRLLNGMNLRGDSPVSTVLPVETWLSLHGMPAAVAYFMQMDQAMADGVLDAQEQGSITASWAPDLMNQGLDLSQSIAALADGDLKRVNVQPVDDFGFLGTLYGSDAAAPLATPTVTELGAHDKGFWCAVMFKDRGFCFSRQVAFVLQDGQWLVYGDRNPFKDPHPVRAMGLRANSSMFFTGLDISIDDETLAGQSLGIRKVVVYNTALPEIPNPMTEGTINGVVLTPQLFGADDNVFRILTPAADIAQLGKNLFYLTDNGLSIESLYYNNKFYLIGLDENNSPLYVWSNTILDFPKTIDRLEQGAAEKFPVTTALGSGDSIYSVSYADVLGGLNMSWQNPVAAYIKTMAVRTEWYSAMSSGTHLVGNREILNPAVADVALSYDDWNNAILDPAPEGWQPGWGLVWLIAETSGGGMYMDAFDFSVEP